MTIKLQILLCIVFYLGKAQEVVKQPEFKISETFVNLGPSTIHSIKGKLYEEKRREFIAKPTAYNEDLTKLNPVPNIAPQSHNILTNITNTELSRQGEKILFRRNNGSSNNTREPMPQTTNNQNVFKYNVPKKSQETQANNSESIMFLQDENLVSKYGKNNTIETIKKELTFDSLLVKNNFTNFSIPSTKKTNPYMRQENYPEVDIIHETIIMPEDQPNRRFESNPNYEPIPPNNFQMDENNFKPFTNNGNEFPNYVQPSQPKSLPLRQNNKPTMDDVLPITPKFEALNYGGNVQNNIDKDMNINTDTVPLTKNSYNVTDKSTCDDKEIDDILERSSNDIELKEPTKGQGISKVGKSRVMLMDHPRVCYACSSISDPSCWSPDRTTAVKYCRADHPSCLTKLYKYKGLSYIIRDCGDICEINAFGGGPTKYTSCTICHHDLCNSAHYFKVHNITILILLIFHLSFSLNVSDIFSRMLYQCKYYVYSL